MKHTPQTAAVAVRNLFEDSIPKTWEQYFAPGHRVNAYEVTKIVQEQCNGINRAKGRVADEPFSFEQCSDAVAIAMPELFAEYWEGLRKKHPDECSQRFDAVERD
jgi:hypothetical protein